MKFDDLIKLYESDQSDESSPPYIVKSTHTIRYYKDRAHTILHREDGPAITDLHSDGSIKYEEWLIDDCTYNPNGPSSRWPDGSYEYRDSKGELHRDDGPARLFVNYPYKGDMLENWFIHGDKLTPEEIEEHKKKLAIKTEIQGHKNNRIDPGMLEDYL